jgi:hypothetical protein
MKKQRIYIVILLTTLVGFILVEIYKPKPLDWTSTFSKKDKIPYGCELLFRTLPDVFISQPIIDEKPLAYQTKQYKKYPSPSNYLYIYQYFKIDSLEALQLIDYVKQGNNAFIVSENFTGLMPWIQIETNYLAQTLPPDSVNINFVNTELNLEKGYSYLKNSVDTYFEINKSFQKNVEILGKNSKGYPNFIRIAVGKGNFYLSSVPKAFTNYNLVNKNADYAFKALSYLPNRTIFWDEYVNKVGLNKQSKRISKSREARGEGDMEGSPFKFIVSDPALKWAYYLTIITVLLYMIFEGKRRQRIIPVIQSPKNTSLEFLETIGSLYYHQRDHKSIATKKIAYFFIYIRTKLYLPTNELTAEFREHLSDKTGISPQEINTLMDCIEKIESREEVTEATLINLNTLIEAFYQAQKMPQ